MRSVKYLGFTASSGAEIDYGTNCVLLNTQIGIGNNPFVQIQPGFNQIQPNFNNQPNFAGQNGFSQNNFNQVPSGLNLNQIQPQFNYGQMLRTSQSNGVQILEPNSAPGVLQRVPQGAKPWLLDPNKVAELEIVTEPQETIIEPVLRNQYLTKLKRLLPTFFDDFNDQKLEAVLLGQNQQLSPELLKEESLNDEEYYTA